MHSVAAAKSNAVFYTHMSLILHLYALAASQYTLNATLPSLNQRTVWSQPYRPRPPAEHFLKCTTQYLLTHKMTHCSTYTTPDLPPMLAARLAVCTGIHSNIYRPLKSSQPTPNIPLRPLPNQNPYSTTRRFLSHTLHYITAISVTPSPTQCTALWRPNPMQSLTRRCGLSCIYPHLLRRSIRSTLHSLP